MSRVAETGDPTYVGYIKINASKTYCSRYRYNLKRRKKWEVRAE